MRHALNRLHSAELPFSEQIQVGVGGRASTQGYGQDTVRQGFTGYEEDSETGLDYAQARYMSPAQGRFASPDPLLASGRVVRPQTWNRYTYVLNNPLRFVDPNGLETVYLNNGFGPNGDIRGGRPQTIGGWVGNDNLRNVVYRQDPVQLPVVPKLDPNAVLPARKPPTFDDKEGAKAAQKELDKAIQQVALVYYIYHSPLAPFINGNITFGEDGNGKVTAKVIPVSNLQKATDALKNASDQFTVNGVFGTHSDEVGPDALSFRSFTVGDNRLGPQSLQINVGQNGVRADIDPSNPDQDLAGFAVHTAPRAGNILKRFFRKIF